MGKFTVNIDELIEIVIKGGSVRTGIDIYNNNGILLLDKNVYINKISPLLIIKKYGIINITVDTEKDGGLWDKNSQHIIKTSSKKIDDIVIEESYKDAGIEKRIKEINEIKKEASIKYEHAKNNIKKVIKGIKETGGEFDVNLVEETVSDVINFMTNSETAFSYMAKEIFSYDDYLYNHSVNVCTIGTAALKKFNDHFSEQINKMVFNSSLSSSVKIDAAETPEASFVYYLPEDLYDIAIGLFLHDIGKVLIPDNILNKKGKLTDEEFTIVKKHTYENGIELLEKNKLNNTVIKNLVGYHHGPLYIGEKNCYPDTKLSIEIPAYVKICKLTDIYDAMTTKRSYKEALNPIGVVTDLFRKYAEKDRMLQFVLHSFVKVVGIYPSGSVVYLVNGQLAYILDSKGPIVLPFTDNKGIKLDKIGNPANISDELAKKKGFVIDRRRPIISPIEICDLLPSFLKSSI